MMQEVQLSGIIPILFIPFDDFGRIDEEGLRRITRFELVGGVQGIGINGFASEAYKLSDEERWVAAQIVAAEVADAVPLLIGIAPNSIRQARAQARRYQALAPAALLTLPPNTMEYGEAALIEFYRELAADSATPIMLQQAPQIPAYRHCALSAEALATLAREATNLPYFKIEGPGSAALIAQLRGQLSAEENDNRRYFGGGGGITALAEWRAGADGLIPGVGFNDAFLQAWSLWRSGDEEAAAAALIALQPLVAAISGAGHEHSIHLRKCLMRDAGYIQNAALRPPSTPPSARADWRSLDLAGDTQPLYRLIHSLDLRVAKTLSVELE